MFFGQVCIAAGASTMGAEKRAPPSEGEQAEKSWHNGQCKFSWQISGWGSDHSV